MRSDYKLKLLSKKLKSGKCQIKFYVSSDTRKSMYGYLLTESNTTLREVVGRIEHKVKSLESAGQYYQSHLYNLATRNRSADQILIFNN
ncbi:hypothetical protein E1176_17275 [Fulvivirga sp. RKSG066]|uniref:hypothetical protein n=1 Tax=Fulvivirga aurantia TaxID=2529383 RepID=UPI0012BCDE2B|nr:hypothetical protein [Fulvivirga aurantia]MTI22787.1 hypothetical protein [Fulvivirga aurantia]